MLPTIFEQPPSNSSLAEGSVHDPESVSTSITETAKRPFNRPPSVKNIFKPRRREYTDEELIFFGNMYPIMRLPVQCWPDKDSRIRPPLFYKGWIIDVSEMRKRAAGSGIEIFSTTNKRPPNIETEITLTDGGLVKVFDPVWTFSLYLDEVVEELKIKLPRENLLDMVWGPTPSGETHPRWHYAFIMYDNYTVSARPKRRDVDRLKQALGLSEEPSWFANMDEMRWRYLKEK